MSLGHPNVNFKYYVDITREESETAGGRFADAAVFSLLLDDADAHDRSKFVPDLVYDA